MPCRKGFILYCLSVEPKGVKLWLSRRNRVEATIGIMVSWFTALPNGCDVQDTFMTSIVRQQTFDLILG